MNTDLLLRDHLVKLLSWRSAHVSFDDAINGIPPEMHGQQHQDLPFSLWQLLEHLRLAQYDILDFCRNPDYTEGVWPDDYWPDAPAPPSPEAWNTSLARFREDLQAMQDLVADTGTDLYAPIPHGDGQTILREALLLADHNAYHVGQIVAVRRLLGLWPPLSNDS
ncbi:MAG: DinB family protein [Rhodothermales bacterium]